MFQCGYCSKIFRTNKILRHHQTHVMYCLKIQEERKALSKKMIELQEIEEAKKRANTKEKDEKIKLQEESKEINCQFCGNHFKTKYLLRTHQTHAKYCLKLQESQNSQEIISCLITCKFCGKNSASTNFAKHDAICKKKNQFLIEEIAMLKIEKEKEIAMLKIEKEKDKEICSIYKAAAERAQATNDEIAKKPTYQKNSTKNIQNNLMISNLTPLDLSQARVDSIIDEKYTKNDFYEGQKGAAHLVHKYIATDSEGKPQIVCTDTERGIFHHKSAVGDHVVDYKNVHLIKKVHSPLKRKAGEFAAEESVKNPTALKEIINNMTSIKDLETKPCLFNRTFAQLTGKNCAKQIDTESLTNEDE